MFTVQLDTLIGWMDLHDFSTLAEADRCMIALTVANPGETYRVV